MTRPGPGSRRKICHHDQDASYPKVNIYKILGDPLDDT